MNKTVLLINPKGGKLPFDCPVKLLQFLDNEFLQGALPDEWKWEAWRSGDKNEVQINKLFNDQVFIEGYEVELFENESQSGFYFKIWDGYAEEYIDVRSSEFLDLHTSYVFADRETAIETAKKLIIENNDREYD
mgnify:FL=1|tara:strand:+ start:998 stop:1399 length:402 start_codon:yes stop_codon:yes gene_type:complete